MPRAHRYHLSGHVWHITHRCHRAQFLLKFARDRQTWIRWLYRARRRYGLCVLDYTVTCNHVHLLVRDRGRGEIAASLQLVAGRTAQAYNRRKHRSGAFWQDRYHATAVDTDAHLGRCLVYIALNMVRAGVVAHPRQWPAGGYHEIQTPARRYRIIDRPALAEGLGIESVAQLAATHAEWIEAAVRTGGVGREPQWTESVAVGRRAFVERIGAELGDRVRGRQVELRGEGFVLRDASAPYVRHFLPKMASQRRFGAAFTA